MLIIARTLALLSILLTLAAIEILGVQYLPIGFEATGVLGGYSFLLATVAGVSALMIAILRRLSGKKAGFSSIAVLSGLVTLLAAELLGMLR